jgi:hypothetical protein
VEIIEMAREAMRGAVRSRFSRLRQLAHHRFHLVEAAPYTGVLSDESKINPDMALLNHLHAAGRTEAEKWLAANRRSIGRRSTVNLRAHFEAVRAGRPSKPAVVKAPAAVPVAPVPGQKTDPPRAAGGRA